MKRSLAIALLVCLLLTGCKAPEKNTPTTGATEITTQATQPVTEVTQQTDAPEKGILYRNPLNGEPLDQPWSGQITAVMINNLKKAMPQRGISAADIFYEIEVEGDITRCLAVFSDLTKATVIGPVRSARTVFNSVAVSYDAPLVHCGGSPGLALAGRYGSSYDVIENWQHIDQAYNDKYFFRDMDRYNSGIAWEHTLFTKGESLQQAVKDKGYYTPETEDYGLQFTEDVVLNGEKAEEITIKFKSGKTTIVTYDAENKEYTINMHGTTHIDGNTEEPVTFQNVIAIYANQYYHSNGMHKFYDSIGTGDGYAAINGEIVKIKWSRESLRSPYTYTLEDGTPLTLETGHTYIALVGIKHQLTYK